MEWTGGCLCGAVRYRLASEPFDAGWCHCRTCQLNSGAPAMAFASVATADWRIEQGEPRRVKSSSFGSRLSCGTCGTPLAMRVDHQPETVDFSIATLDDMQRIALEFHIFWASKLSWFEPGDDLPRYDRFRPDTRGLERTEPPA